MDDISIFVEACIRRSDTSKTISQEACMRIFVPNGLPKLILVDAGSIFCGEVEALCKLLHISFVTLSSGNHRVVLVDWFFCFLNKVVCTIAMDSFS